MYKETYPFMKFPFQAKGKGFELKGKFLNELNINSVFI